MIIIKFGGTSISSKQNIENIKGIISQKKDNYLLVVSAFSGITNLLEKISDLALQEFPSKEIETFRATHIDFIKEIIPLKEQTNLLLAVQQKCNELENICNGIHTLNELSSRTKAKILSMGEQLSSTILHSHLQSEGVSIELLDSNPLITATGDYLNGTVDFEKTNANISQAVDKKKNYITGGFVGSNHEKETVLLGRGGSDYTASIYANALHAEAIEIWSDVDGIHSADPRKVKNTISTESMSYEEAFEMAYFGAKVLFPPSILPLTYKKIPLYLKNTFHPEHKGTSIGLENIDSPDKIKGLSSLNNVAIITISGIGLAKNQGSARKAFQALEEKNINIILITQSCSEQSIGIGIKQENLSVATQALDNTFKMEIASGLMNPTKNIKDQCIIAMVGDNMKSKAGLSGKIFGAIGENGINVTAIAQGASERNISIVINQKDETKALNVIHEKFFSSVVKDVHLFITGIGNVGGEFLKIIYSQKEKLIQNHQINLKIIGVANSRKMLLDANGLSKEDISQLEENGQTYKEAKEFFNQIVNLNLRNSVFIDNTASEKVSNEYLQLLSNSISIVTCNKIASSSSFSNYSNLLKAAKEHNCHFKYETSVGAALPVINTISDLRVSGDTIHKIEAVISGSLNFIFNEYNEENKFADVVLKAKEHGYTEPNPLIDLSGLDVMRKILILSRESGFEKELDDITFTSFLPEVCEKSESIDELFQSLRENEQHFKEIYLAAKNNGNKLKVLATLDKGNISVALREIAPDSPFYHLEGKDNVIAINTDRYENEPLVIKGAGAGASVTASGVFADLIAIVNK